MSATVNSLLSYLVWLEENTEMKDWIENTSSLKRLNFQNLTMELRFLQGIFWCVESFFCQDLPLESEENEDESLGSLFNILEAAIYEKSQEIHSVCQEIYKGLDLEYSGFTDLVSSLHAMMEALEPVIKKALDKYRYSSLSKHCTKEELLEFIQSTSEDRKEISHQETIESLKYKLEFLTIFIGFAASRGVRQEKMLDLLAHTEVWAVNAAYLSYLCSAGGRRGESLPAIKSRCSEMLQSQPDVQETYIRILEASRTSGSSNCLRMDDNIVGDFIGSLLDNYWELLSSKSNFTVSTMKTIIEELSFLRNFLIYQREKLGDLHGEMTDLIGALVSEAGIIICSLSRDEMEEGPTKDTEHGLSRWVKKLKYIKVDIGELYPETSRYNFPRTNELGFMDGLLENLKELIEYKPDSIASIQEKIGVVLEDLEFLRDFQREIVEQRSEHEELKALWVRVIEVAYRIELVIESIMVGDPSPASTSTSFNTMKEEIKNIKTEVKEIYMEKRYQIGAFSDVNTSNRLPSRSSKPLMDEVMVGFEYEAKAIIDQLKAGSAQLDIVSIIGMPGLGKTTLTKKVYNDIRFHFHVSAWCCVSQGYQKRKLLLDIFNDIADELPNGSTGMSDEDLENVLRKSLKGRRYLIVLDDVWDIDAWHDLQLCFPNDSNGSRILLTSRIHNVALKAKRESTPYSLRLLTDDESWQLLQEKLFHNKGCPPELCEVGMQIAKGCKGLPLAVVIISGILATLEQDRWEDFAKSLSSSTVSGTDQCVELLELSYMHLPDYLKPCLLYFGSFLQDQEIHISRLMWLWTAEGFVQKPAERSLDNVAEDYLIDLIDRSLVMVAKQRSKGGVKACHVHDLVHQFCVTKAKEENFLQLRKDCYKLGPFIDTRRLCIYSVREEFCKARLFSNSLRSLLFFRTAGDTSIDSYDLSSIFRNFKLVKVLNLGSIDIGKDFPSEVEMLVHLRYLALLGGIRSIPSTAVKLRNLETFHVKGTRGEILLPHTLLSMAKLRHLHVNVRVVFSLPEENLEKCLELCNLESFASPLLSSGQDMVKILKKLPNIQKLRCIFSGSLDSKEGYQFPELNFLSQLESLKVLSTGKVQYQLEFSFPSNLRKMTLSKFCLPWAKISRFSELPSLEVLKLLTRACEGKIWDVEEEVEFPKLRYLKLENLDIEHWNACSDNFPCLRQLVLQRCRKLQSIPYGLAEFTSLEMIELKWCHHIAASSAQKILEEEREGLKVSIYPPDWSNISPEEGS